MISSTISFVFRYFVTMTVVMSLPAVVALFVSMTSFYTIKERVRTAGIGCLVGLVVIEFFAMFGVKIFGLFGISMGSFYVAGGLLILLIGLDMLRAQDSDDRITEEELEESKSIAKKKGDVSITPLGVPIIVGPCAITSAIAQQAKATNCMEFTGGLIALALVIGLLYGCLVLSSHGAKWLTPAVIKLTYRLTGLILAAMAFEMIITGIKSKDLGLFPEKPQIAQVISIEKARATENATC
ncbi:MAG: MarC family protein [Puniceicoccales bacterium]|jgi:multiple antibiotic resistance protein|nr:MarC family protein [Puniceicoccales bacterium]